MTMTWDGRRLASVMGGAVATYKYDANGMRASKTTGGAKTEYFYNGSQLAGQRTGGDYMHFSYGADGTIGRVHYSDNGGSTYKYLYPVTNVRGDIIALITGAGVLSVKYTYDSWGKLVSVTDANGAAITDMNHIAHRFPFRYRGYYYDNETGLFYVNTRYYDPTTGRFLNADGQLNGGILGDNMFTYCLNNPVNMCDCNGTCPHQIFGDCVDCYLYKRTNPSFGSESSFPFSSPNPNGNFLFSKANRKPGKTPPSSWPPLPDVFGKKPTWNPAGYWETKEGNITWDGKSHGAGVDRGNGPQDGIETEIH